MDLNTLVGILRRQASSQQKVVFNGDFLSAAQISAVQAGFGLGASDYLTIDSISSGDIPDPSGGQVVLTAGTIDALSQQKLAQRTVFTVDGSQSLQFTVEAQLADGWQFTSSFPTLTVYPFDQVKATQSAAVYATQKADSYAPWSGQPSATVPLSPGLNLAAWLQLDVFGGALALLEQVINGTRSYLFAGPIAVSTGAPYPVLDLRSPLTATGFTILPGQLTLGSLALEIAIAAPQASLQNPALRFSSSFETLDFGVELLRDDLVLSFFAEPFSGQSFGLNQILALPFASGFQQYIPQSLTSLFDAATLQSFVITQGADSAIGMIGLDVGSNPGATLPLIDGVLVLQELRFEMATVAPQTTALTTVSLAASAQLFPSVFTSPFSFAMELSQGGGQGWQISRITGAYQGSVNLGDLVGAIVGNTALVPSVLKDLSFANFGVMVTQEGNAYSYTLYGQLDAALPIMDTTLVSSLSVSATYSPSGTKVALAGSFLVGQENFQLSLDLGTSGAQVPQSPTIIMRAGWKAMDASGYLQFEDIATAFGFSGSQIPTIPASLDLGLSSADFYYDYTNSKLLIGLTSATYGSADFAAVVNPKGGAWQFFFGLNIDKPIPLSNLPLIGDLLPEEDTVEITKIQVVIASALFDDALATSVNQIIGQLGDQYPLVPDSDGQGMPAGLGFAMNVAVGSYQIPIMFGAGQGGGGGGGDAVGFEQLPSSSESMPRARFLALPAAEHGSALTREFARASAPVRTAASSDGILWFNLQKTFGPVTIQKIGVQYKDEAIYVLVNMALTSSGLTIGVLGLGVGSSISDFEPRFTIQGLDVTYSGAGVLVSGGLRGTMDPVNFVGELMVNVGAFGIAGLAGYTTVEGSPSLFLYAVLNAPLGGPPFFFVDGLAGGFGFNRDLQVPDVSGVSTFPLVEWAQGQGSPPGMNMGGDIGAQVDDVLQRLSETGVVAPMAGESWLAAGVKFTSFELAQSFALMAIKFGSQVEVDLLGSSIISVPPKEAVIYAELQILGSFRPSEGFIGVAGQLTSRSYVLSPSCHLTGGFAYYLWFGGPHQGAFVITMGGYSPHFDVPDFYPKVPRLGINWNVSDNLVVKGDEYFAVTSAAVMAGGGLSATWKSGGIKAWFNVQADFLMVYQPFHYYIGAGIDVGCSVRVNLLFTHVTLSVHVGAYLEIWGPDFTGKAKVDLSIISFTISFGASGKKKTTTIAWPDFVQQMLPGVASGSGDAEVLSARRTVGLSGKRTMGLARRRLPAYRLREAASGRRGGAAASSSSVAAQQQRAGGQLDNNGASSGISIDVTTGLVKSFAGSGGELDFVVSPDTTVLTVGTAIPIKESHATYSGMVKLAPPGLQPTDPNDPDGPPITPSEAFGVGPVGTDATGFLPTFDLSIAPTRPVGGAPDVTLQCIRVLSNVPNALWQKIPFNGNGSPVLSNPLGDTTIANVVTGYRVVPIPTVPDHTLPISLEYLKYTIDPRIQHFSWSPAYVPQSGDFPDTTVESSIMSATAVANRAALLPALHAYLPNLASTVDVATLTDPTHAALLAQPVMRLLGEERTA